MRRAIFLDRDGVVNELIYHHEAGVIDAPFMVDQVKLRPGAARAIGSFKDAGFAVVLVSNQPGVAKGQMSRRTLDDINDRLLSLLSDEGAELDGVYYCLHHPEACDPAYRMDCACRKPKPGLLIKAASELNIDLEASVMIGDNVSDLVAGADAGCRTVLVGRAKCESCRLLDEAGVEPDIIAADLGFSVEMLKKEGFFWKFTSIPRTSTR